jgi:hypothetical protein
MFKKSIEEFFSGSCKSGCIEINFAWGDKFKDAWFGCTISNRKSTYWFGLTQDGANAYNFNKLADFKSAKVFDGKSLEVIWSELEIFPDSSSMPVWYYEEKAKDKNTNK